MVPEPVPLWPYVEPLPVVLEPVPLWPDVEPVLLFGDEVSTWPLRSLPIEDVSLDFAVAEPAVPVDEVSPEAATWPWLPAALCVPCTEPCVVVPVSEVARVDLFELEHATNSAAAPSAVMT